MRKKIVYHIVARAESLVGVAQWKCAAQSYEAPDFVNCSSLIRWLYLKEDVTLPKRSHEQLLNIIPRKNLEQAQMGDLFFVTSPYNKGKKTNDQTGLHVCLVIDKNTVICATNSELGKGVVRLSIEKLLQTRQFVAVGEAVDSPDITEFVSGEIDY